MKTELLLKLAYLLDTVPEEQFNYATWAASKTSQASIGTCGTTACALGWATILEGTNLTLDFSYQRWTPRVRHAYGALGTSAAQAAFDLEEEEAQALFLPSVFYKPLHKYSPGEDATAREVADWIRAVVEDWRSRTGEALEDVGLSLARHVEGASCLFLDTRGR